MVCRAEHQLAVFEQALRARPENESLQVAAPKAGVEDIDGWRLSAEISVLH
jgi:hypothetical protein